MATRGSYVNDPRSKALDAVDKFARFHEFHKSVDEPDSAAERDSSANLSERIKSFYTSYYASRSMMDDAAIIGQLTCARCRART